MRWFVRAILILLSILPLHADIDDQIDAIQNASAQERFKLMNAFKKEVVKMQEEERINAIKKLQRLTESSKHPKTKKHLQKDSDKTNRRIENTVENQIENAMTGHIENAIEEHIENETEDKHDD